MLEPSLHWVKALIPMRLALMARPRGGEDLHDELAALRRAGVDTVVSLLEAHEVRELELQAEANLCREHGIAFIALPIKDRGVPASQQAVSNVLAHLHAELCAGRSVAVHCRAGIGRTGLVAGCLLHLLGVPRNEIFQALSSARGVTVPDTAEQVEWVEAFARA